MSDRMKMVVFLAVWFIVMVTAAGLSIRSNTNAISACEKAGGTPVGNAHTCISKDAVINP